MRVSLKPFSIIGFAKAFNGLMTGDTASRRESDRTAKVTLGIALKSSEKCLNNRVESPSSEENEP